MGYYIDQMAERDRKMRLADLFGMGGSEDFTVNQPQQMPQQMPQSPQNFLRNESTGAQYNFVQSQPQGPALDYSSPIEIGGYGKGYRIKGDPLSAVLSDGRIVRMGADTGADRKRQMEDLKLAKEQQDLVNSQLLNKKAQAEYEELYGNGVQGGGFVLPPTPIVGFGGPVQGTDINQPSGAQQQVAQMSQRALERRYGKPEPGERWDNQGNAIQIPGHSKPLGETQKKQVTGVQNLSAAIDEYQNELKNWSAVDIINPDKRAGMGVKYNNMMLQAKEAYNLGVLNGPDFEILTSVVTDPRSLTGAITSNKAMANQAAELKRIMQTVGENASNSAPKIKPLPSGSAQQSETSKPSGKHPRVTNDAEYNALPRGAIYITPTGETRTKR